MIVGINLVSLVILYNYNFNKGAVQNVKDLTHTLNDRYYGHYISLHKGRLRSVKPTRRE